MQEIFGNTAGLSPKAKQTLERIYRRRVPLDDITTPELVRSLADASFETHRQVGALVHRSGSVEWVVVGTASGLMLPDIGRLRAAQGRFRALRLVHTHLYGEPLTRDDLVDLTRLKLDLVCAILLNPGFEPRSITWAHNIPERPIQKQRDDEGESYRRLREAEGRRDKSQQQWVERRDSAYDIAGPMPWGRPMPNFGELIRSLEAEFARLGGSQEVGEERAILLHVDKRGPQAMQRAKASMRELASLALTAGVKVSDQIIQLRDQVDPKLVLGKGKLEEVVMRAIDLEAKVLIFDRELTPAQASGIAATTDLRVIDRTQLILDIFAQRAETRDGKLQVELAQLKYRLPRLGQKDDALSRLTGGIGGRGPGETKLEIGRRRARERVTRLEQELLTLAKQREQRRRRRTESSVPVVAIVGYTNAGKSTLLNTLTGAGVLAEDKLFATLDTRARRLLLPDGTDVVLTDTVGFIRDMPKDLFAAFRATFEEAADADLLLEVIDWSDPEHEQHARTTAKILEELEFHDIPRLVARNKVDLVEPSDSEPLLDADPNVMPLCAQDRESAKRLLARIAELLAGRAPKGTNVQPNAH